MRHTLHRFLAQLSRCTPVTALQDPVAKGTGVGWWWWSSRSVVSDSCDPVDCSLSGSSVHGILQARMLEWIAAKGGACL